MANRKQAPDAITSVTLPEGATSGDRLEIQIGVPAILAGVFGTDAPLFSQPADTKVGAKADRRWRNLVAIAIPLSGTKLYLRAILKANWTQGAESMDIDVRFANMDRFGKEPAILSDDDETAAAFESFRVSLREAAKSWFKAEVAAGHISAVATASKAKGESVKASDLGMRLG